jgi:hypothetical protein
MAAADLLDIWRAALLNIGAKSSIVSVTEQSTEAAACALRYPSIVATILRETDWNCVRRRVGLEEVAAGAVHAPSWAYMYRYPADCLVVRGFDLGFPQARFPVWTMVDYEVADDAVAGKSILTNIACPVMIYTSYTLDLANGTCEGKFDAALREAVGWALAAVIAGPLTGNRALALDVRKEAKAMLDLARAANANESATNAMHPPDADSIAVRGGYWPYGAEPFYWNRTR